MRVVHVNKDRVANEQRAEEFIKKFYEKEEIRIQKKIMKEGYVSQKKQQGTHKK